MAGPGSSTSAADDAAGDSPTVAEAQRDPPIHPGAESTAPAVTVDSDALLKPPLWSALPRTGLPLSVGVAVALLVHFIAPELGGFSSLVAIAGVNIVLAVSLNIVNGLAGQFSIGHAGFMAMGGYLGSALIYYGSFRIWGSADFQGGSLSWGGRVGGFEGPPFGPGDLLFLAGCIFGGIVAAIAGWLVGLPSLRLRGDYLAIVTLGFGEIVRVLIQTSKGQYQPGYYQPDAAQNIASTPFPVLLTHLGGAQPMSGLPVYATPFWIFVWVAITLMVAYRLKFSSYGRALLSIREDPVAARSIGVHVSRYNVRAFTLSAFFAGVGGVLWAMYFGSINAAEMDFKRSFDLVIMVVLGGLGSVSGAVIAAILLAVLPSLFKPTPPSLMPWGLVVVVLIAIVIGFRAYRPLRGVITLLILAALYEIALQLALHFNVSLHSAQPMLYALALIVIMIVRPQGLLGVHEIWEVWPLNRLLPRLGFLRRGWLRLTGGGDA